MKTDEEVFYSTEEEEDVARAGFMGSLLGQPDNGIPGAAQFAALV